MSQLFIGGLGLQEILLLVLVILLFFGGRKIPEMMRGIGEGVRSFKDGMNNIPESKDKNKGEDQSKSNTTSEAEDESKQ